MKSWLLVPAAFALAACDRPEGGDAAAAGSDPMSRVQNVEVVEVVTRDLEEKVELVGSIEANESAEMRAELSGVVREIHFEEGRPVKKGEPLLALDTRELEAQIAETRARAQLAEKNFARSEELMRGNAISQLEFENAQAESAQARAALQLLEVRLEKSTLNAPFDGVAGGRSVSVGDFLTPETVVTTIVDLSRLKISLSVPERYLPVLKPGSTFNLRTTTTDDTITGEVYFVAPRIDLATRSAEVKGYVQDPPETLRPGMFANVSLILKRVENALVVPETAILNTEKGSVVIVARESDGGFVAEFVPVRLGLRVPGFVQVSPVGPPLVEGDRVVASGVGGLILMPGMNLNPIAPLRPPGPPPGTDRALSPETTATAEEEPAASE